MGVTSFERASVDRSTAIFHMKVDDVKPLRTCTLRIFIPSGVHFSTSPGNHEFSAHMSTLAPGRNTLKVLWRCRGTVSGITMSASARFSSWASSWAKGGFYK